MFCSLICWFWAGPQHPEAEWSTLFQVWKQKGCRSIMSVQLSLNLFANLKVGEHWHGNEMNEEEGVQLPFHVYWPTRRPASASAGKFSGTVENTSSAATPGVHVEWRIFCHDRYSDDDLDFGWTPDVFIVSVCISKVTEKNFFIT